MMAVHTSNIEPLESARPGLLQCVAVGRGRPQTSCHMCIIRRAAAAARRILHVTVPTATSRNFPAAPGCAAWVGTVPRTGWSRWNATRAITSKDF